VWWTWEPRLTTSAVLWVIYAAYLILWAITFGYLLTLGARQKRLQRELEELRQSERIRREPPTPNAL